MNEMNYERKDKESASNRVEFTPPADFKSPENVAPGKDFDLVCSFRVKPSGELCLTKLGDHDMPGYGAKEDQDKDGEPKHNPGYGEYVGNLGLSDGMPGSAPAPQS